MKLYDEVIHVVQPFAMASENNRLRALYIYFQDRDSLVTRLVKQSGYVQPGNFAALGRPALTNLARSLASVSVHSL